MIYYMSTKTLVKIFEKEHSPNEILDCVFISFSTRVIPTTNTRTITYDNRIFFGLEANKDEFNIDLVKNGIRNNARTCGVITQMLLEALVDKTKIFIILSSPAESKTRYPYFLAKAIEDLYKYPIIDYKNDRFKDFSYNPKEVLNRINHSRALIKLRSLTQDDFRKLPKKQKKMLFKTIGIYEKGMDVEEMIDIFEQRFGWGLPFHI